MAICQHCETELGGGVTPTAPESPVDRQCFACGSFLTDEKIAALMGGFSGDDIAPVTNVQEHNV